jgi:peptide/nickel transport system permease protein
MLDALDAEYVKLARINGIPNWKVVWKHAFRNALIPPLTYFGIILGTMVTGAVTVETVFAWPGVGLLALDAVTARDYQVIEAITMTISAAFILINLAVDTLYTIIDPRILEA